MVIGNGAMGKTGSYRLKRQEQDVTVTVRQYRSGIVEIPRGCERIDYGDRMSPVSQMRSGSHATASPNYTLKKRTGGSRGYGS